MKIIKRFFLIIFAIIAILNPILNFGVFSIGYVYIDDALKIEHFSYYLLAAMFVNAAFALFCALFYKKSRRVPIPMYFVIFLSVVLSVFFTLVNYVTSTLAIPEATGYLIIGLIPILAAVFGSLFALFFLPTFKPKARKVVAGILFAAVVFTCSAYGFKLVPFEFTMTDPIVLDIGTGYSVTWGTNAESIGSLVYVKDGKPHELWCHDEGNKRLGVIHSVLIPYDELNGATYSVHSIRSHGTVTFGNHLGKSIHSDSFEFSDDRDTVDRLNIATFSDWQHGVGYLLKDTMSHLEGNVDLLIVSGDYSDYFVNENMVVSNVIDSIAQATRGVIPVIFVKGNHESRSRGLYKVWTKLGLEKAYYQVDRNGILFTVLDCGEVNPNGDANYEYGGMNIFAQYDQEQLDWYQALPIRNDRYNILLSHNSNEFPYYYGSEYGEVMRAMHTQLVIGGHTGRHEVRFYEGLYRFDEGGWEEEGEAIAPLDLVLGNVKFSFENLKRLFVKNYYYFIGGQVIISADRADITFNIIRNDTGVISSETHPSLQPLPVI
ncbi:MAG: metallophosphoesterase [Clostridiales bacterium]|jgi:UDP-2,3-diacylglucosamine pyrophosphatase LpxH|nr:metallophosphoesterase [Clostridiales bacterium]